MKWKKFSIVSMALGTLLGVSAGKMIASEKKSSVNWKEMSDKHLYLMVTLNKWLETKQEGKSVIDYFHQNKISTIAVYGMSYLGERLCEELKDSDIEVKYVIDKNKQGLNTNLDVFNLEDKLEIVDAIVVTPVFYFDEIEEELEKVTDMLILSLEDILFEI